MDDRRTDREGGITPTNPRDGLLKLQAADSRRCAAIGALAGLRVNSWGTVCLVILSGIARFRMAIHATSRQTIVIPVTNVQWLLLATVESIHDRKCLHLAARGGILSGDGCHYSIDAVGLCFDDAGLPARLSSRRRRSGESAFCNYCCRRIGRVNMSGSSSFDLGSLRLIPDCSRG